MVQALCCCLQVKNKTFGPLEEQNSHDMKKRAHQLNPYWNQGEVSSKIKIPTYLTSGIFLSLPRNSFPVGIFIFSTDYFTNVFNLIQKKK